MRAVRLLLILLAALLVLALLAAWQIPGRLDWNRYRGTIESLASATLGRPVSIAGPITLSLLPETELTAADVVVGSSAPGEGSAPSLTVKALRLRVAPLPLLSGRVDARELALSGPDLAVDWPLQRGEFADWPPHWLSAFAARIERGRLRVGGLVLEGIEATLETTEAGGLIAVGSGRLGGQPVRFTARLTASGNDGASGLNLAIEGQDRFAGVTGVFVGQLAADGGLAGRIDIGGPDLSKLIPAAVTPAPAGSAAVSAAPGNASPGGTTTNAAPLGSAGAGATPGGAFKMGAFKVGAVVKAAGEKAGFDDLTIDVAGPGGTTSLAGTAVLRLAPGLRLDARLSTARLELDPWVSLLAQAGGSGLTVGLELKAEAVAFGGGLMRQLAAALEVTPAQIALREVTVQLPGEADLRLAGTVQRGDPARPRFDGSVRLAAPRLREVLRWLDGAGMRLLPDLPEGVLTSTDFRAHAVAEPGLLALDRIEGWLDGTSMSGELRMWPRLRPAAGSTAAGSTTRPGAGSVAAGAPGSGSAVLASLELGSLQLDPWLADPLPRPIDAGRGFDVDLRLRTPLARLRGEAITALSLDAAVQSSGQGAPAPAAPATQAPAAGQSPPPPAVAVGPAVMTGTGKITLRQLEATIRGVRLTASGMVAEGGRLTEGKLQASTDDASTLADLVAPAWRPAEGFWRGPAALNVQLAGPAEALGVRLTLDMADARLEAQPVIDLRSGKWSGSVTLRHPGAPRLLGLLGLAGAEAWLGEGSLSVIAHVSGVPGPGAPGPGGQGYGGVGRVSTEMLDVTAGLLRFSAPLTLDRMGGLPVLSGQVQADALALPAPAWRDPTPLPFALLRGWRGNLKLTARQMLVARAPVLSQVSGTLSLADGVLRADPFSAVMAGGALNLALVANAAADPPAVAVTAALADATAAGPAVTEEPGTQNLDLLAGRVNASADLGAAGHSPAAMLATLSGGMTLTVTDGVLAGFDLFRVTRAVATADPRTRPAAEAALRAALTGGVTNFDRLAIRAEAQSGTAVLQEGMLAGSAGTAEFSGSVGLRTPTLDLRIALHPAVEAPPEIAVRLTGPWEKPRRSPELAGFLRWLAERGAPAP
jgi:hypothetical protein